MAEEMNVTEAAEEAVEERAIVFEEALEAILFAAGHPVSYATLARVFEMTPAKVKDKVFEYAVKYNDPEIPRGVVLLTYGDTANGQTTYTEESYQAFLDAYNEAKNLSRDLGSGDQDYIDEIATTLEKAAKTEAQGGGLIEATSKEVVFEFVTEDPGIFFDQDYNLTYTPTLTTEYADMLGAVALPDGTTVDGFIVGFGANIYSEDEVAQIFSTLENGSLYAEPTELGCYATGSVVQVLDADGNAVATYLICIRGDVNGDGLVNDADAGIIQGVANWVDGYDYMYDASLNKQVHGWACDINLDYGVDDGDKGIALNVGISNNIIDQVNGGVL